MVKHMDERRNDGVDFRFERHDRARGSKRCISSVPIRRIKGVSEGRYSCTLYVTSWVRFKETSRKRCDKLLSI